MIEYSQEQVQIAKLLANKFIARPDVKAIQMSDGSYRPDRSKITKTDLLRHLNGQETLGHYIVNPQDNIVKLFAFDIDLVKEAPLVSEVDEDGIPKSWIIGNPREHWRSRAKGPARDSLRHQMRSLSHQLASAIQTELEVPALVTYSGSKGVHVYAMTGPVSAELARKGAAIVLASTQRWKLSRGKNFYRYEDSSLARDDYESQFPQFSLEVYPKQDTMESKDLGNLLRLPLGVNTRSPKDPTMFIDMRCALSEMVPRDPIDALTATNAFA